MKTKSKKLYSFDIFDTIVTRKVGIPTGIFALMQEKIKNDENLPQIFREDFYSVRKDSEAFARDDAKRLYERIEVSFDDIYSFMQNKFKLSFDTVNYLKQLEIETEQENLVPITDNIEKVKTLINKGERVVLISDMYYSAEILHKLLSFVDTVFNDIKIYVSADYNAVKWDKSLYKKVKQEEEVEYRHWEHFGDNKISDFKNAKKLGIKAGLYNYTKLLHYENDILAAYPDNAEYQLLVGASRIARLNSKVTKNRDKYEFGVSMSGPLLYNFVNHIIDEAMQKGFKTLHFIARDGYIPIMVADAIIKARKLDLKTKYVYASRLVWRIPSEESYEPFVYSMIQDFIARMTFRFLAKRLNVDPEELNKKFFHYDNIDTVLSDQERVEIKEVLLNNPDVKKYILDVNKKTLELSMEYIKQEFDLSTDTIALVDIHGSGQTSNILSRNINSFKKCEIKTFYFSHDFSGRSVDAVLPSEYIYFKKPKPFYFHMELLYRAPHGQTTGYKNVEGKIEPILESCFSESIYSWGFQEYLEGILDFTNQILKVRNNIDNVNFDYYYFDYISEKITPKIAAILGDVPSLGIGKEENKAAGPKITIFDMFKLFIQHKDITTIAECSFLSISRRNTFTRFVEFKLAGFLYQLPIVTELKLYFKLRKLKKQNKKVMLWGASLFLEEFIKKYHVRNDNIIGVIDKNPMRKGTYWLNYKVYLPNEIKMNKPDYILLTVKNRNQEIYCDVNSYIRENYPDIEFGPNIFV